MNQDEIVISTGNILSSEHLRKRVNIGPQEELIDSLKESLRTSVSQLQHPPSGQSRIECGTFSQETGEPLSEEERNDLKITAKIYLLHSSAEAVKCAISEGLKLLNTKSIDLVLVAFPSNDFKDFEDSWKGLEESVKGGTASVIGVSDFDANELDKLYSAANIKPTVNQVNLESCCVIPPELSDFSKAHHIQLLTHNDPRHLLTPEIATEILDTTKDSVNLSSWEADWLLKYSVMVKSRGVVKSRGYLLSIRKSRR